VKPYHLLKSALEKTGKVAIGKIALRDREHLCRLALHGNGLLLNTLHWPDEIRRMEDLSLPEADVKVHDRELDMAVMLIENLSASFDPSRYHDDYREAVLAVVDAKLQNRPLELPVARPAQAADLMEALKASVEASREARRKAS
jgi:DNA end-binding protein Ku